ncbi:MAG TPA: hypothetical protein VEW07_10135 [Solirubrobacterales bacterium]|nr:hypothetical protein [Solirubrobacterales bacterium]
MSKPPGDKRATPKKAGAGFWDRHDIRLKRFGLIFGIATGIVSLVALAVAQLGGGDPPVASPVTADEQRLVDSIPPTVGWRCRSERPVPVHNRVAREMRALTSAYAVCAPLPEGPASLHFRSFTTKSEMTEYMRKLFRSMDQPAGGCSGGSSGYTPWVDDSGRERGDLICHTSVLNSGVYWSDNRGLFVGIAQMASGKSSPLYSWWQEAVRFEGGAPDDAAERKLRSVLPDSFGGCDTHPRMPAVATAGLTCKPGRGIWAAGTALIPDESLLAGYIETRAAAFADLSDKGCKESTRSFTIYGPGADAKPVRGRLLCHADDGQQWFEWTATRPRVYAYLSRTDESLTKLFHQWSTSLSAIKGPITPR